jgi:hypothetical protein
MKTQKARLTLATAMFWIGLSLGLGGRAEGGGIVLNTPGGLSDGETFRFVFITQGTTVATSSSIANYNSFVNAQAGGAAYAGSVVNWDAIGSTAAVSALQNIGQTTTPVYLVDGTLVTTSTTSTGLWSGSISHAIDEDILGMSLHTGSTGVWTGTNTNGSASSNHLGNFFGVVTGNSVSTNGTWVNNGVWPVDNTSGVFHIYGISETLTAVPEPSTLGMAGTAVLAVVGFGWRRGRRDHLKEGNVETGALWPEARFEERAHARQIDRD